MKAAVRATSSNPKLHLQICTTFNVLNSYYWPETERWINDIGITDIHYNILQGPAEFNLRNLTSLAKQAYRNRMEQARDNKISNVIGFMELPGEDMSGKLLARIAKNDAYRKQHLSEYHRNVWDILNG